MGLIRFTFKTLKILHLFSKVKLPIKKRCCYDYNQVPTFFIKTHATLQVGSSRNNNHIAKIMFLKQLHYQSSEQVIKMERDFSLWLPTENATERTHRLSFAKYKPYFNAFALHLKNRSFRYKYVKEGKMWAINDKLER
jgi:hypothetical protein